MGTNQSVLVLAVNSEAEYVPNGSSLGPTAMHRYGAYLFDADGHIIDRIDLTCGDDESAKARAKEFLEGHVVELWDGGSRRSSLVAKAKPASRGRRCAHGGTL